MTFKHYAFTFIVLFLVTAVTLNAQGQVISAAYGPPATANEWEKFTIPLTPETFNVDEATFDAVLANVQTFRIRTEMRNGNDVGSVDQISIGSLHSSTFESGTVGWNAAGDGTMEWVSSGGISGGYIQISDWASGDWHYAVAPLSWSGDWRSAKNDSLQFYFKTDFPDIASIVEISSVAGKRLILAANTLSIPKGGSSTMSVTLSEASATGITVNLTSSSSCVEIPAAVIVPANQTFAEFLATVPADAEDGCASVITATASEYGTSRVTLNVENDAEQLATLTGRVTDATTGVGIVGANVSIAGVSTTTVTDGVYTLENIPTNTLSANFSADPRSGNAPLTVQFTDLSGSTFQTLTVSGDSYIDYEAPISLNPGMTTTVNVSLSPIITDNVLRFVLNWADAPRDLDIHLLVPPEEDGGSPYQVYYSSKGRVDEYPYALLDIDKRQGFGPETITLKQFIPGRYVCFIHNYSGEADLTASEGVLQIYGRAGLLHTINVPTSGSGEYWSVCDIDGATGQVTVKNVLEEMQPRSAPLGKLAAKSQFDQSIAAIESWEWDFDNDGTIDATEQNPMHIYAHSGEYTVTLKVSDGSTTYIETKENFISVASSGTDPTGYDVSITGIDVSDFPLVKCFVSVNDQLANRPVNGLGLTNFATIEDDEGVIDMSVSAMSSAAGAKADIVFVFDETGSMGEEISMLKERALAFADSLMSRGIDYRLGLTTFNDEVGAIHDFTSDASEFKTWIDGLTAEGGGDTKENGLEGIAAATRLSFRDNTQKIIILITDADYHEAGESGDGSTDYTTESMISLLKNMHITANVIGPDLSQHKRIADETGGQYYNIFGDFGDIINRIGEQITSQYVVVYTSPVSQADNTWRDVRITALNGASGGVGAGSYHIGSTRLLMNPPTIMGRKDDTFMVDVLVESVVDLAMTHFFVVYDFTKIEALNIWEGDFLAQGENVSSAFVREIKNSAGYVEISASRLANGGEPSVSGSGLLARIEFRILKDECTSDIGFQAPELRRPDDADIPGTTSGASLVSYGQAGASSLLCDFDNDLDIDTRDFALLGTYWKPSNGTTGDVGPSVGAVPLLAPNPDAIVNYEDLFVFTRMWNWYHAANTRESSGLAKSESELTWDVIPTADPNLLRASFHLDIVRNLAMGHVLINYNSASIKMKKADAGMLLTPDNSSVAFMVEEHSPGELEISFSRLPAVGKTANVSGSGELMAIQFERIDDSQSMNLAVDDLDLRSARNTQVYVKTAVVNDQESNMSAPIFYSLSSYPNPFNSRTTIEFDLPVEGDVRVDVVNILGQSIRTLQDEKMSAGSYKIAWDGANEIGEQVVTGMYLIRLKTPQQHLTRKILYLK
jgi:VWFA-related protein